MYDLSDIRMMGYVCRDCKRFNVCTNICMLGPDEESPDQPACIEFRLRREDDET